MTNRKTYGFYLLCFTFFKKLFIIILKTVKNHNEIYIQLKLLYFSIISFFLVNFSLTASSSLSVDEKKLFCALNSCPLKQEGTELIVGINSITFEGFDFQKLKGERFFRLFF